MNVRFLMVKSPIVQAPLHRDGASGDGDIIAAERYHLDELDGQCCTAENDPKERPHHDP